ncbi:putative urease accessory protein UreF-like [Pseudocercospora fuligena]|uniref:Putative urease accessory protein UreF-like n=1 Tax=Pseudocercospora fuligena TaxID=685502 RepID=A0A8H6RDT6_9PEZI|nr:putative urease accessory protein UreF-like [Pseudocercospora fuligena]
MASQNGLPDRPRPTSVLNPALHSLLLLSDSALPLGSFAFSSGLESFLAHKGLSGPKASSTKLSSFEAFLEQSLWNIASTSLPYVLTAFHRPSRLTELDNDMDASTPCTVARRASVTQGKALVEVWTRALNGAANPASLGTAEVTSFATQLKSNIPDTFGFTLQGHFAPLFGAVCAALNLSEHEASYLFLLNHSKALLSAAVRASVMGPYQSQAVLASSRLQTTIGKCIDQNWQTVQGGLAHEDAVVTVPTMDLWMGRHELLYSRIFNS